MVGSQEEIGGQSGGGNRSLDTFIEMGQECGEVEREARTKGGKRTLGNGHQDARMQCLTQVVFPI